MAISNNMESNHKLLWVIITVIVIIFAIISGYLYYLLLNLQKVTGNEIRFFANNSEKIYRDFNDKIAQFDTNVNQLDAKYSQLLLDKYKITKYQLNELISLANQSLLLYHDTRGAIKLLNYAKELVNNSEDANLSVMKYAINHDITQLTYEINIDIAAIITQMDYVYNNVDNLHVFSENLIENNVLSVNESDNSKWQSFVTQIKKDVAKVISINKINDSNLDFSSQQESLMKNDIKINLLSAKIALYAKDDRVWKQSLSNVQKSVNTYFNMSNLSVLMLNQIAELQKLSISNSNCNIDTTLNALAKFNLSN